MTDDVIKDMLRLVIEASGVKPETAQRVEQDLRLRWGGATVYIKKAPSEGKAFSLGVSLAAGASLHEAVQLAGVSRATAFRLLRRRWLRR